MELYAAIDLHSNNSVVTVLDEADRTVYAKRLPNDLGMIMAALRSCEGTLRGVAVESTYNWYWRAPCKGGAFQRVQGPPGKRSSRKHRSSEGGNELTEAFGKSRVTTW